MSSNDEFVENPNIEKLVKSQKQSHQEALNYMRGRKEGSITSFLTPWDSVNKVTIDGFEWQSTIVIGARSGSGKTLMKDQIIREGYDLNPSNFRVLEFSLEMVGKITAMRNYTAFLGRSYKYLCSADGNLSKEDLLKCIDYSKKMLQYPIDIVERKVTIKQFKEIVSYYLEKYKLAPKRYTNFIITIDHTILFRREKGQSVNDMLYALGEALTELKRKYPIIFIVLSQLNRNIDHPDRNEDGKYGNYVLDSDIFGSDGILQHADTVIGLNRPAQRKIKIFGPDKYIVPDDKLLVFHYLKMRNGETGMSFFNAEFENMKIVETLPPAQKQMRTNI